MIQLGGTGDSAQLTVKPPQVVLHAAQKDHVLPLVGLGQDLVRDAERLLIVPLLHWARQRNARQYSS